jgi:hypothetical protein
MGMATWIINGRIFNEKLAPLRGVYVSAYEKLFDNEKYCNDAEVPTDISGNYTITFDIENMPVNYRPDLLVKVKKAPDDVEPIAESEIRFNASRQQTINVIVPLEKLDLGNEFDRLTGDLMTQIPDSSRDGRNDPDTKLGNLDESEKRQVTYLANKTGWDARLVAMRSLAASLSEEAKNDPENSVDIPPKYWYALLRAGLPANPDILSQVNLDTIEKIWEHALDEEKSIIPEEDGDNLVEIKTRFEQYRVTHILNPQKHVGVSTMGDLLSLSLGGSANENNREKFAQLYANHRENLNQFWHEVEKDPDLKDHVDTLKLDGKLAFLSINNKQIVEILRGEPEVERKGVLGLVREGYFRQDKWDWIFDHQNSPEIPEEIPGEDDAEKRENYKAYMAHQLKLSYPTAVIAQKLNPRAAAPEIYIPEEHRQAVYAFLTNDEVEGTFELGLHPVEQFCQEKNIQVDDVTLSQLKRLQRVYQISPSDEVMEALLSEDNKIDSAYAIVQYDEAEFVDKYRDSLGEADARLTYAKAHQVHNATLNILTNYLTAKYAPQALALPPGLSSDSNSNGTRSRSEQPSLPAATLEGLMGEMDYCTCEHCRSWLSPAAYLVDLLQFLDQTKTNAAGDPLPGSGNAGQSNPLDMLLDKRPDIEHLQLSCDNTNVVLPYIDLVNEILEYFVVHNPGGALPGLTGFKGHNIPQGITSDELLANPQFVEAAAYTELKDGTFPLALPFHQPLEALRRYFNHFEIPLHTAMETLQRDDWLIEQLQISPREYEILTKQVSIEESYGVADVQTLRSKFSNAKTFCREFGIRYEELIQILQTEWVNPSTCLVPKLEQLGVSLVAIIEVFSGANDDNPSDTTIKRELLTHIDDESEADNWCQWLRDNYTAIQNLIILVDPSGGTETCKFDQLELRYAKDYNSLQDYLADRVFFQLLFLIRLWKKLGWTISFTGKVCRKLLGSGTGALNALVHHIARFRREVEALDLSTEIELLKLLACFRDIDTFGKDSLYRHMFLNLTILTLDSAFAETSDGQYLTDETQKIDGHRDALQAAFQLKQDELKLILNHLEYNDQTPLLLNHVSKIFRHAFLARQLRLSQREFLGLITLSGINPFYVHQTKKFIELVQLIQRSNIIIPQLLYFLQHEDLSGHASPSKADMLAFAKTIREALAQITQAQTVVDDPSGEIAKAKMVLVYAPEVVDIFFGLVNDAWIFTVSYDHDQPELSEEILAVTDKLVYDNFQKQLSFRGLMTEAVFTALRAIPDVSSGFQRAIGNLVKLGQLKFRDFFEQYPELEAVFERYTEDNDYSVILESFLPTFLQKLKKQQIKQLVSTQTDTDFETTSLLLDTPELLYAAEPSEPFSVNYNHPQAELEEDIQNVTARLSYDHGRRKLYFRGCMTEVIRSQLEQANNASDAFRAAIQQLYEETQAANIAAVDDFQLLEIRGITKTILQTSELGDGPRPELVIRKAEIWQWYLEVPEDGFYNFYFNASVTTFTPGGTSVKPIKGDASVMLDGQPVTLSYEQQAWQNQEPLEFKAGHLYEIKLVYRQLPILANIGVSWASPSILKEPIPEAYQYPYRQVERFLCTWLRCLKSFALWDRLSITDRDEIYHFGTCDRYYVDSQGWLNSLPVEDSGADKVLRNAKSLFNVVGQLLRYTELKAELNVKDATLVKIFDDSEATAEDGSLLLTQVTGWDDDSLNAFLTHFRCVIADLNHPDALIRIKSACDMADTLGISAADLLDVTTNDPTVDIVGTLQKALQARYDDRDWFKVVQPINDELRSLQRDALVAKVLHILQQHEATQHIDTPDKLFEYLLIDVQMASCMKTSRIKQAISGVQLFIQRCLLNLEPEVAPSQIKRNQWEWMKRYRLWEANRKVFLYPENWLEPELRDDKSPFFKELESELLQSDITKDAAATACIHYLQKLDDVAQLEICGLFYEEHKRNDRADNVVHVIGRIPDTTTYYYRRLEGGTWSPWEKIDVPIEGNPVLPVVWRGRLFLFWYRVLEKIPTDKTKSPLVGDSEQLITAQKIDPSKVNNEVKEVVELVLNWSEYCSGKWQLLKKS